MKKVFVVGCGAYIDSGYGCPGCWRCLKAAALGEGNFDEESQVVGFVKCKCPGRTIVPNVKMTMNLSGITPDKIYLSSCLANAVPKCPYFDPEEIAKMLEKATGVTVELGTHKY